MASYASAVFALLAGLVPYLLYITAKWYLGARRPPNYPPGPPGFLGLGNLHQIPDLYHYRTLDAWAKKYGPIVGLKMGSKNVVMLNDAALVYELMVKRASSFPDRPPMWLAQTHVIPEAAHSYGLFVRNDYGNKIRSLSKHLLTGTGPSLLAPMHKAAATRLVYDLLEDGEEWRQHIRPWGVTTPAAMVTGAPFENITKEFGRRWIDNYYDAQQLWFEMLNPTLPAYLFPILRWLPAKFAEYKRKAPIARKALLHVWGSLVDEGKKTFKQGGGAFTPLALVPKLLSEVPDPSNPRIFSEYKDTTTEEEQVNLAVFMGGLFDGSIGSTLMSLQTIILGLAAYPEAQKNCQAEIDALFGDEHLPDKLDQRDLEKLPFLHACALEGQRWRPPGSFAMGSFGLPRECTKDEEILGYTIPKGTSVVINQFTIAQDPEFYDDPDSFIPSRYIEEPNGLKKGVSQVGRRPGYSFGIGRRECPGKALFFQNIEIALSHVLWAFDIVAEEHLDTSFQTGYLPKIAMIPKPFKIKFVPRRSREVLLQEKEKAEASVSQFFA